MAEFGDGHSTLPLFDPFDDSSYFDNCIDYRGDNDNLNFPCGEAMIAEPPPSPPSLPVHHHQSADGGTVGEFDPPQDPLIWVGNSEAGPLGNNIEEGGGIPLQTHSNSGFENVMQIPVQPSPHAPVPFGCSFCQVLREIIHTNGNHATKLEVHGRLGIICHAILENRQTGEYRTFDFCKESMDNVKKFLSQYCEERKQAGYVMLQDPLQIFYEALCTGLDCDDDFNVDEYLQTSPIDLDLSRTAEEFQANEQEKVPKTYLASQRERAANLTMRDVEKYFNVPIEEAAKKVGVCPTVVKKICRKNGIYRWPHRKIKSIERKMEILKASLNSSDPEVRGCARDGIVRLRVKMNDIYAGAPQ